MRFTQQEKYEIIKLVDQSDLSANWTLKELGSIEEPFTTGTSVIRKMDMMDLLLNNLIGVKFGIKSLQNNRLL